MEKFSVWSNLSKSNNQNQDFVSWTNPKNKKKTDQPWWMDTLDFIARPQRAITGGLANITDRDRNTTLLGGVWGGLSGREKKDFDEVMNNLGWKQNERDGRYDFFKGQKGKFDLFDIVNFAGNVGLDPLTYLTLGGSSIAKSGARAMADEAVRQGAKYGVEVGGSKYLKGSAKRMANNTASLIEEEIIKQLSKGRELTPEKLAQIERIANKKATRSQIAIDNVGKKARLDDQNALINFDVPFTNISKSFGKKGKWLKLEDNVAEAAQVTGALNMLSKVGGSAATPEEIESLLKTRYGKNKLEELTQQELNDLQQLSKLNYSRQEITTTATPKTSRKDLANELERIIKTINPDSAVKAEGLAKTFSKKNLYKRLNDIVTAANKQRGSANTFKSEAMDLLGNYKFQQGSGGVSKLGNKLRPFNPFNKRTVFDNTDFLINRGANFKTETDNKILSQTRQVEKDVEQLESMKKGIEDEELEAVGFYIEGKFPKKYKDLEDYLVQTVGHSRNAEKIKDIANFIQQRIARYSAREQKAGLLNNLRSGYFPHIQDFDAQEAAGIRQGIEENLYDPVIGKFLQQSSKNPYANNRKKFQTLAEVDDTIDVLRAKISEVEEGTPEYEKVFKQIELLQNLFKRDPIKVFQERTKTAIRSAAMKELQDQYELDGLIIRNVKLVKKDEKSKPQLPDDLLQQNYKRLDAKEAEALGLSKIIGRGKNEVIVIKDDLYKFLTSSTRYSEVEAVNRAAEIVNTVTNLFKVLYTSAVPKHYWYNLVGSAFNNTMAGVTVDSYFKAGNLIKKLKDGTLTEKELVLIERAFDEGILNQTGYADLVRPEILEKGRKATMRDRDRQFYKTIDAFNQKIVDNPVSTNMRRFVGDPVDNLMRLAHFVHVLETTRNIKLASESVRVHLFNYNEVTQADRFIKVGLPFWNWMKNNIPLQISKFITEPRIAATYNKLKDQTFSEKEPEEMPNYIQEGFMQLPFAENSFYNPRLPLQDLSQLGTPKQFMETGLNALTPVFKMPLEGFFNHQVFSDKPISYRAMYDKDTGYLSNERSREELSKYLINNLGILGDTGDLVKNYTVTPEEERKKNFDLLTDWLFGATTSVEER